MNTIDNHINSYLEPISNAVTSFVFSSFSFLETEIPLIVIWLLFASFFFTFYFRFVNVRYFSRAIKVAMGRYDHPNHPGEITHFQSF